VIAKWRCHGVVSKTLSVFAGFVAPAYVVALEGAEGADDEVIEAFGVGGVLGDFGEAGVEAG
jgi:hypothetical protein